MDAEIKPLDAGTLARFAAKVTSAMQAQRELTDYMQQRSARLAALKRAFTAQLSAAELEAKGDKRLEAILAASGLTMWTP